MSLSNCHDRVFSFCDKGHAIEYANISSYVGEEEGNRDDVALLFEWEQLNESIGGRHYENAADGNDDSQGKTEIIIILYEIASERGQTSQDDSKQDILNKILAVLIEDDWRQDDIAHVKDI
jgi:hypothetical protein